MENTFRLPKAFAEKWIAALRSGEYKQGASFLLNFLLIGDEETGEMQKRLLPQNEWRFCCLGVGCHIAGVEESVFCGEELIDPSFGKNIPIELLNVPEDGNLVERLTDMNDGRNCEKKSFSEIADWIEQNVTLY